MSKILGDALCAVGEYTDAHGAKKKRYLKVGAFFSDENGQPSLKLDAIPLGVAPGGVWVNCYPQQQSTAPTVGGGFAQQVPQQGAQRW